MTDRCKDLINFNDCELQIKNSATRVTCTASRGLLLMMQNRYFETGKDRTSTIGVLLLQHFNVGLAVECSS